MERANDSAKFKHAIVIGRSMAGLLAARGVQDYFEKVTIIDRDKNPPRPAARKGVPQGRHIHVLLKAGKEVLEEFFPNIISEVKGIRVIDSARDFVWRHLGVWKSRYESRIEMVLCTRPLLEWHVRRRLVEKKNTKIMTRTSFEEFLVNEAGDKIEGVVVKNNWGLSRKIEADLVIDATGRGSRTPRWLESNGYKKPHREEFGINITYTSRLFKAPAGFSEDWEALLLYPRPPAQKRAGLVSRVENDCFIVSLNGYFGEEAPTDQEGYLEYAKGLSSHEIYDFLKVAKPVSPFAMHKIPSAARNYYEKLSRFPDGLVVLGDAVCALNPIFGQGMTTAGMEARALKQELAAALDTKNERGLSGIGLRFFKHLPGILGTPWFLTTTEDLRYEETTGPRMFGLGILNWYKEKLIELTSVNDRINQELWKVIHLQKGVPNVLKPDVSLSVLAYGIKSLFQPLARRAKIKGVPDVNQTGSKENARDFDAQVSA